MGSDNYAGSDGSAPAPSALGPLTASCCGQHLCTRPLLCKCQDGPHHTRLRQLPHVLASPQQLLQAAVCRAQEEALCRHGREIGGEVTFSLQKHKQLPTLPIPAHSAKPWAFQTTALQPLPHLSPAQLTAAAEPGPPARRCAAGAASKP